jgi:phosphate transport system substrate-binding protein
MTQNFLLKRRNFLLALSAFSGAVITSQLPLKRALGALTLNGAGASFPAPLYTRWFSEYNKVNSGVQISYQSVGSGAGVKNFIEGIVDFGASDVAMTDEEIAQVSAGVVLLPMTAGSIVVAYNQPAIQDLQLTQEQLIGIFMGKITNWKDLGGPDQAINVVYRSDGSGTTGVFTKNLSAMSPEWQSSIGEGKTVSWPVGQGAKGNEGVAAAIQQTEGSIGYIEYGYAQLLGITTAKLQNKAGNFIAATPESASATLSQVELPANLREFITNPEGADSYPIVTYTWILAYQKYQDAQKAEALKNVFKWCLQDGQKFSTELGYIPLPENVVAKVTAAVDTIS